MISRILLTAIFITLSGVSQLGWADHPVSIVEADIYVQRFKTTMRLKCFAEDLDLLQGVEPYDDGMYDPDELLDAHQDHAKFLAERIVLMDAQGVAIKPRITNIGEFDVPDEGIMQGMLMNYELQYELEFKYDAPPEFLTINQKLVAEGMLLPSELKILLKQAGSDEPVLHMMKPDIPKVFAFDWDRAPLSSDATPEEQEKWFEEQREKTLGISSYSSVYSFIYITETEVRHEVLIPAASLATFINFDRKDESFLEIDEQDAAKPMIEALFGAKQNVVKIDGVVVQPVFDRIDFYGLEIRDFVTLAPRRKISMASGRVGVIMSYSTKGSPQNVEVSWETFNQTVKSIDVRVIAYDKAYQTEFSKFLIDDTYVWTDPGRPPLPPITGIDTSQFDYDQLKIPSVTIALLVLAGLLALCARKLLGNGVALGLASALAVTSIFTTHINKIRIDAPWATSIDDTDEIFAQLHKNVFRAFDYHREDEIYDALANSVAGPQLQSMYLDIRESLRIKEEGGAAARIEEVNFIEGHSVRPSESAKSPSFGYRCRWDLVGTIEHWGHVHQRTTQYDAMFDVELIDDAWKITSMQIVDQEPGLVKNEVRRFEMPVESEESDDSDSSQNKESTVDPVASQPTNPEPKDG